MRACTSPPQARLPRSAEGRPRSASCVSSARSCCSAVSGAVSRASHVTLCTQVIVYPPPPASQFSEFPEGACFRTVPSGCAPRTSSGFAACRCASTTSGVAGLTGLAGASAKTGAALPNDARATNAMTTLRMIVSSCRVFVGAGSYRTYQRITVMLLTVGTNLAGRLAPSVQNTTARGTRTHRHLPP